MLTQEKRNMLGTLMKKKQNTGYKDAYIVKTLKSPPNLFLFPKINPKTPNPNSK